MGLARTWLIALFFLGIVVLSFSVEASPVVDSVVIGPDYWKQQHDHMLANNGEMMDISYEEVFGDDVEYKCTASVNDASSVTFDITLTSEGPGGEEESYGGTIGHQPNGIYELEIPLDKIKAGGNIGCEVTARNGEEEAYGAVNPMLVAQFDLTPIENLELGNVVSPIRLIGGNKPFFFVIGGVQFWSNTITIFEKEVEIGYSYDGPGGDYEETKDIVLNPLMGITPSTVKQDLEGDYHGNDALSVLRMLKRANENVRVTFLNEEGMPKVPGTYEFDVFVNRDEAIKESNYENNNLRANPEYSDELDRIVYIHKRPMKILWVYLYRNIALDVPLPGDEPPIVNEGFAFIESALPLAHGDEGIFLVRSFRDVPISMNNAKFATDPGEASKEARDHAFYSLEALRKEYNADLAVGFTGDGEFMYDEGLGHDAKGFSWDPGSYPWQNGFLKSILINTGRADMATLAHEMGHVYLNAGEEYGRGVGPGGDGDISSGKAIKNPGWCFNPPRGDICTSRQGGPQFDEVGPRFNIWTEYSIDDQVRWSNSMLDMIEHDEDLQYQYNCGAYKWLNVMGNANGQRSWVSYGYYNGMLNKFLVRLKILTDEVENE
ncbi:hypothetical protein CMI47_18605 [Candidatus Pacearchaeota archaeon]|nr:hypothetical protein [Candidatus Pacearchaeota archaeon]